MIVVFGTMVRTPSYVIRALRLLGVGVRSVEVEVKGEVNDRNRWVQTLAAVARLRVWIAIELGMH